MCVRAHQCLIETKEETEGVGLLSRLSGQKKSWQLSLTLLLKNEFSCFHPSFHDADPVLFFSLFSSLFLYPDRENSAVRSRSTSARHNSTLLSHNEMLQSISNICVGLKLSSIQIQRPQVGWRLMLRSKLVRKRLVAQKTPMKVSFSGCCKETGLRWCTSRESVRNHKLETASGANTAFLFGIQNNDYFLSSF